MRIDSIHWTYLAIVLLCLTLSGCTGITASPNFYMLGPAAPASANLNPVAASAGIRIGLDPVEVPQYLNQPQIVTHLDRAEYQLDEFNRWMEPLSNNLTRVIAENLSTLLQAEAIDILYMSRPVKTRYAMNIQILRMDGKLGESAYLIARWSFFDNSDNTLMDTQRFVFREKVEEETYQALLQAQNRMVETLNRNIADGIRQILSRKGVL